MPTDLLPPVLREHVHAVAEALQVPTDLVLLLDLGALAIAAQGLAHVQVMPDWREDLALFVMAVLPSGERKSPAFREAFQPLREAERVLRDGHYARAIEQTARHEVLIQRVEQAKKALAAEKPETPDWHARGHDLEDAANALAQSSKGVVPRLLADDVTPEALVGLLADHGRIGVASPEGGFLETLAGRYANALANLDALLKAFYGEPITVDRRGREPERVDHPLASITLAVQPDVIQTVLANRTMMRRGFMPRFLLSAPRSRVGNRSINPPAIPSGARAQWNSCVRHLVEARAACLESPESPLEALEASVGLTLADDAREVFDRYREEVEMAMHAPDGEYSEVPEFGSKAPGLLVRIAGLLHLAKHGKDGLNQPIDETSVHAARGIVEVHMDHVLHLTQSEVVDPDVRAARVIHSWVVETETSIMSQQDIFQACRKRGGGPKTAEQTKVALLHLASMRLARELPPPPPTGGRPASNEWELFDEPYSIGHEGPYFVTHSSDNLQRNERGMP